MQEQPGFLIDHVTCPVCLGLHDLFVTDSTSILANYRFTCPHTGNMATWLCDKAAQVVQEQPTGSIHAIRHDD